MIKVTDEAVDAACDVTWAGRQLTPRNARAVLEAAVPHLQVQASGDGEVLRGKLERDKLFSILVEFIMAQPQRADVVEYDEVLDQIMELATTVLPVATREHVSDVLETAWLAEAEAKTVDSPRGHCEHLASTLLVAGVFREPIQVDREAVEREIRRATTAMLCNSDIPGWTMQEEVSKAADAVLALLSPEETKAPGCGCEWDEDGPTPCDLHRNTVTPQSTVSAYGETAALDVLLHLSENSTDGRLRDAIATVRSALHDRVDALSTSGEVKP